MESMVDRTLALTGDVMLGRLANDALVRCGPAHPWGNTLPALCAADLAIVNLECVIARGGRPWTRWPKVFHFRADPVALTALRLAGIDGVTLANNHVLDYGEDALLEMLDRIPISAKPVKRTAKPAAAPADVATPKLPSGRPSATRR